MTQPILPSIRVNSLNPSHENLQTNTQKYIIPTIIGKLKFPEQS